MENLLTVAPTTMEVTSVVPPVSAVPYAKTDEERGAERAAALEAYDKDHDLDKLIKRMGQTASDTPMETVTAEAVTATTPAADTGKEDKKEEKKEKKEVKKVYPHTADGAFEKMLDGVQQAFDFSLNRLKKEKNMADVIKEKYEKALGAEVMEWNWEFNKTLKPLLSDPDVVETALDEKCTFRRMYRYIHRQMDELLVQPNFYLDPNTYRGEHAPDELVDEWVTQFFTVDCKKEIEAERKREEENRKKKAEAEEKEKKRRERREKRQAKEAASQVVPAISSIPTAPTVSTVSAETEDVPAATSDSTAPVTSASSVAPTTDIAEMEVKPATPSAAASTEVEKTTPVESVPPVITTYTMNTSEEHTEKHHKTRSKSNEIEGQMSLFDLFGAI